MVTKRMICLANSRKLQGRCVAGVELVQSKPSGWLRPVSDRENQEVSEYERLYEDGSDPQLLDVIDIPLLEARPKDYQQENWLLDPNQYWRKVDSLDWGDLHAIAQISGTLWRNGCHTYNGTHDQIAVNDANDETHSLALIHVDALKLRVFAPGTAFGNSKRRVQGRFVFSRVTYALWITDPKIERAYLAEADGEYQLGECYLTVSLGEPYNEHCHKLIAAVLERPA